MVLFLWSLEGLFKYVFFSSIAKRQFCILSVALFFLFLSLAFSFCWQYYLYLKQFCFVHSNIIFIAIRFFVCFPVCSFSAFSILFYHVEVFDCHSIVFSSSIFLFACFLLYLFFSFCRTLLNWLYVFACIFSFLLTLRRSLLLFLVFPSLKSMFFSNSSEKKHFFLEVSVCKL